MSLRNRISFHGFIIVCAGVLGACSPQGQFINPLTVQDSTPTAHLNSEQSLSSSNSLLNERRVAETSKYYVPSISAIGFSSIAIQPSKKSKPTQTDGNSSSKVRCLQKSD